ncbi:hypothetical protein RJ55_04658 [Drechmeria coniospora]|nr:hypothetical protein RJ55_04658 [Drechmeria coniospora]
MATLSKAPSVHSAASDSADVSSTAPQSLARAVLARRSEYVRPCSVRVKIGTWNVAACPGTDKDLARWFVAGRGVDENTTRLQTSRNAAVERATGESVDSVRLVGGDHVGLYVLGLQEVVDLSLTRDYVNRAVYTDHSSIDKWQAALEAAMPPGYELVASEQMLGLLLLIYASPEIAPTITNVSSKQVGTGILGYFGNKGAVATRLVLGETTRMAFVNCHLASGAGSNYLERRCWDVGQILAKTQFDPVVHSGVTEDGGERIGDEDFAFWFGDLNFRLDGLPGDDIRRLLTLHARGEYGKPGGNRRQSLDGNRDGGDEGRDGDGDEDEDGIIVMRSSESDDETDGRSQEHIDSDTEPDDFPNDPSQDPTSLQATLDSLLPHDQLKRLIGQRKLFHDGWREGPIAFLPSYKYDIGTVGLFDSSDKQRAPSWCDRILYRTRKDKLGHDTRLREELASKKKDEEMRSRGLEEDDDVLFSYDPETDGDEQAVGNSEVKYDPYDDTTDNRELVEEDVVTKEGYLDHIAQDMYTSHQRITSSDHKPVVSVFTLQYDTVVPELKAKIHAEVARELDRAENEGRPKVTIVVEGGPEDDGNAVDLGSVGLLETATAVITVANTGGVPANFTFVEKPPPEAGEDPVPVWLTTRFRRPAEEGTDFLGRTVTLEPGETILAQIEAQISDIIHLRALNDGHARLEDVLVLRVEDGRDHFIPVRARWLPTCFGRSIDELIRVPDGGIRSFVLDKGIVGAIPDDAAVHCSAPKELFKLTEAIQTMAERCVADESMLEAMTLPRDPGWPFDASTWAAGPTEQTPVKARIVAAMDTDSSVLEALPVELQSSSKLELLSAVLLLFLASLTDGLVPRQLWTKLSTSLPNLTSLPTSAWADIKSQVLELLSSAPNHNIAFVFLTSTVSRVVAEISPTTAPELSGLPGLGRRLSFRRVNDEISRRRRSREKRYAETLGPLVFRANDKEKAMKEKERIIVEMFLRRETDD